MTADPLPGIDTHLNPAAPGLPDHLDGILARDPWTLICRDCGITSTARSVLAAIDLAGLCLRFMGVGWPDGRFDTAMSFQEIPILSPVPSALEQASLAANRLA